MSGGICYIAGAGEDCGLDFVPRTEDYVIAADAGFLALERSHIRIDMAVGDFDTLDFIPVHPNVVVLNREKDTTDMQSAVHEGIKRGYRNFHIYGGTGGRVEHTVANMQLLTELSQGGRRGFLFGKDYVMTALTDGEIEFNETASGFVSVFAHSCRAEGVCLRNLKYGLDNAVLTNTNPVGISNEFIGKKSCVSVQNGTLMIIYPKFRYISLKNVAF